TVGLMPRSVQWCFRELQSMHLELINRRMLEWLHGQSRQTRRRMGHFEDLACHSRALRAKLKWRKSQPVSELILSNYVGKISCVKVILPSPARRLITA